ncbi:hypothetical protein ABZ504_35480 [Streptomyces mirabilis]|uniref:hypothetical protein n=1 Tax=Streptomyces mirabilis TaxID=68239 RepID=UPI0033F3DDF4
MLATDLMTSAPTRASGSGRMRCAAANSGTQVTSRLTTSYWALPDWSAPSSWLRCWSAEPGSSTRRAWTSLCSLSCWAFHASMSCWRMPPLPVTSRPLATTMSPEAPGVAVAPGPACPPPLQAVSSRARASPYP